MGESVENVCGSFDKVYTIELCPKLAQKAIQKFTKESHVHVIQGDSSLKMPDICKELDLPTFFWLDGHWSGGNTARGPVDCPLLEECRAIADHCKVEAVIAIDDVRLFDKKLGEDWTGITKEKILKVFEQRTKSVR